MNILEKSKKEYEKKRNKKEQLNLESFKYNLQKLLKLNDSELDELKNDFYYHDKNLSIKIDDIIFIFDCGINILKECKRCGKHVQTTYGRIETYEDIFLAINDFKKINNFLTSSFYWEEHSCNFSHLFSNSLERKK